LSKLGRRRLTLLMLNVAIFMVRQHWLSAGTRFRPAYGSGSEINCLIASSAAVPLVIVSILPGRLAFNAVTAFLGQIPMHLVSIIRTSRRWLFCLSASLSADRSVASPLGPYPPFNFRAHLPHKRMTVFHGVWRTMMERAAPGCRSLK